MWRLSAEGEWRRSVFYERVLLVFINHSGSETVEVRLCADDGNAVLEIQDGGKGFN
jgi:nitrate/nitrite-specific signal transduction histidine kinase